MPADPARALRHLAVASLIVGGLAGVAAAEKVQTTDTTKVYREIGEQSPVVTKVAEGTTLTVLKRDGRWLKVRVNGRTGWITRSTVTSLDGDDDVPRNTRRRPFVDGRSQRRGWGSSAPDDRVGADAVDVGAGDDDEGGDEPEVRKPPPKPKREKPTRVKKPARDVDDDDDGGDDDDSGEADDRAEAPEMVVVTATKVSLYPRASRKAKATRTLRRGAKLVVLERGDTWTRVEYDDDAGYVSTDAVEDLFVDDDPGPARRPRTITTKARLGFASLGGRFTSNGPANATTPPANYAVDPTALSLALGAEVVYAYKRDYYVGGGVEYLGCWSTPGIHFADEDIGFKTHDVDLRLVGGYDLHDRRGTVVWGRLGYHVGITSFSDLMNPAQLPSETFRGPSVGAGVTIPRITSQIGAGATVDLVYPGTRTQTQNNEDGELDSAMGATVALGGAYAWRGDWNVEAGYRFGYRKTRWTGPSNRINGATEAARTDLNHVLTVGLGRAF